MHLPAISKYMFTGGSWTISFGEQFWLYWHFTTILRENIHAKSDKTSMQCSCWRQVLFQIPKGIYRTDRASYQLLIVPCQITQPPISYTSTHFPTRHTLHKHTNPNCTQFKKAAPAAKLPKVNGMPFLHTKCYQWWHTLYGIKGSQHYSVGSVLSSKHLLQLLLLYIYIYDVYNVYIPTTNWVSVISSLGTTVFYNLSLSSRTNNLTLIFCSSFCVSCTCRYLWFCDGKVLYGHSHFHTR